MSSRCVETRWEELFGALCLVDATCCRCILRCPLAVLILAVQYCLTLALVRPGKLVNQPLFIAVSQVLIGGAPSVMWWKLISAGTVRIVRLFALCNLGSGCLVVFPR